MQDSTCPSFVARASMAPVSVARATRPWALVALLAIGALLPACGVSTAPLALQVRDAESRQPIAGAGVEADSYALGPSLKFGDILDDLRGRRGAHVSRGLTGPDGSATLEYIPGRQVRLTVLRPGAPPAFALIDGDQFVRSSEWYPADPGPNVPGTLEFRAARSARVTSP